MKAYILSSKLRSPPNERNVRDVWFTNKIKDAASYTTREEAEIDIRLVFEPEHIEIIAPSGQEFPIKDFQVEERSAGEFVVSFEWPLAVPGT